MISSWSKKIAGGPCGGHMRMPSWHIDREGPPITMLPPSTILSHRAIPSILFPGGLFNSQTPAGSLMLLALSAFCDSRSVQSGTSLIPRSLGKDVMRCANLSRYMFFPRVFFVKFFQRLPTVRSRSAHACSTREQGSSNASTSRFLENWLGFRLHM